MSTEKDVEKMPELEHKNAWIVKLQAENEQLHKNVQHWMEESFRWHNQSLAERKELAELRERVEKCESALKFYADRKKWREFVLEYGDMFGSRDGDMCMAFDSEDDSPWAVARNALSGVESKGDK